MKPNYGENPDKKETFLRQVKSLARKYRNSGGIELMLELANRVREDSIPDDVPAAAQKFVELLKKAHPPQKFWLN